MELRGNDIEASEFLLRNSAQGSDFKRNGMQDAAVTKFGCEASKLAVSRGTVFEIDGVSTSRGYALGSFTLESFSLPLRTRICSSPRRIKF